jgi:hypothetical protein
LRFEELFRMVLGGLWIFKTCEMPFTLVVSITLYSSCSAGGILPSKGLFCFAFPAACCIFCLLRYDLVSYHFLGVHIRRVMSGTGITALCALALMIEEGPTDVGRRKEVAAFDQYSWGLHNKEWMGLGWGG